MVRLNTKDQGRDHGDCLLPGDAATISLSYEEVVKLEIDFLSSDIFPGGIQLVSKTVRVPGEDFGDDDISTLSQEFCQLLEILAFYDLQNSISVGSSSSNPEKVSN